MSPSDFDTYFHRRASRFAAFYRSEPVARLLGRGPLFDRLRGGVDIVTTLGARHVLDVGCGSGPLFAAPGGPGRARDRDRPRPGHGRAGPSRGAAAPGLGDGGGTGMGDPRRSTTPTTPRSRWACSTTSTTPAELLRRMGRAAPHVVASFPAARAPVAAPEAALRRPRCARTRLPARRPRPAGDDLGSRGRGDQTSGARRVPRALRARHVLDTPADKGIEEREPARRHGVEAEALQTAPARRLTHGPSPTRARYQAGRGLDHGVDVVDVRRRSHWCRRRRWSARRARPWPPPAAPSTRLR